MCKFPFPGVFQEPRTAISQRSRSVSNVIITEIDFHKPDAKLHLIMYFIVTPYDMIKNVFH